MAVSKRIIHQIVIGLRRTQVRGQLLTNSCCVIGMVKTNVEIVLIVQRCLLDIGEQQRLPGREKVTSRGASTDSQHADGKDTVRRLIVVQRQSDLANIVLATCPPGSFSGLLYRWQQQRDQNRDDGNHNKQLNQSEGLHFRMRKSVPNQIAWLRYLEIEEFQSDTDCRGSQL